MIGQAETTNPTLELICRTLDDLDPDGTIRTRVNTKGDAIAASPAPSFDGNLPSLDRRIARARKWLARAPGGIQGSNGSKDTFAAARALVRGFLLDADTALDLLLSDHNPKCDPAWSVRELEHKIADAQTKPYHKEPGWLLVPKNPPAVVSAPAAPTPAGVPVGQPPSAPAAQPAAEQFLNEADDDPHKLARAVLAGYQNAKRVTLVYWRGEFHEWDGTRYRTLADTEFRATINRTIYRELAAQHKVKLESHDSANGELPKMPKVSRVLVGNVVGALEGMCILRAVTESPAWLADAGPDPCEIVATGNGLVHLPAYATGAPNALLPNTPNYLNFNAVSFAADRDAPEPVQWLKFLETLWPDDPESVNLLQEWFGYLLTPDTSQQKMLLMVGPPRSGKGTIARVVQELIGFDNCCNPTLGVLGTPFGLSSLVGKSMAVIEDARLSARSDAGVVTERLLTISGEGRIDVDRKHRDILTARLPVRFVVATNELPRLSDASGALARRWCLLRLTKSFLGKEDKELRDRLLGELSGVFNWAVAGWTRLQAQGRFTEPKSAADLVDDLNATGSPVGEFVKERCQVGDKFTTEVEELYAEWKRWCETAGRKEAGTVNRFGIDLRAFLPCIRKERPRTSEGRITVYRGIRLKPDGFNFDEESSSVSGHDGHDDRPMYTEEGKEGSSTPIGDTGSGRHDHRDQVTAFGEGEL